MITSGTTRPGLDFSINVSYLLARPGGTLLRNATTIDKDRQWVVLSVTVRILPQQTGYEYELTTYYQLYPQQKRLDRWARLVRNRPRPKENLDGFRFRLPGVVIGQSGDFIRTPADVKKPRPNLRRATFFGTDYFGTVCDRW